MKKRIISLLLCFCMTASLFSGVTISAFAEEVAVPVESLPAAESVESVPVSAVEDVPAVDTIPTEIPAEIPVVEAIEIAPAEAVAAELQATYSGSCGENLVWTVDSNTGVLSITGSGPMNNFYNQSNGAPWSKYTDIIKAVEIGNGVTTIGDYAFPYLKNVSNASISNTVTHIGIRAFWLTSIATITIPSSVTSIGECAFSSTDNLTSIVVSETNPVFCSADGVLLNKDKTKLIFHRVHLNL